MNNLSDASSNIVSLVGFKLGSRPADSEHPYGHARYEYLAGLAVSVMILVIGVELLKGELRQGIASHRSTVRLADGSRTDCFHPGSSCG